MPSGALAVTDSEQQAQHVFSDGDAWQSGATVSVWFIVSKRQTNPPGLAWVRACVR